MSRRLAKYLGALEHGIGELADNPESGTRRDNLMKDYWSKRIKHHVVFYTFTDVEVRIRRVLHGRMDVGRHL